LVGLVNGVAVIAAIRPMDWFGWRGCTDFDGLDSMCRFEIRDLKYDDQNLKPLLKIWVYKTSNAAWAL